MKKFTVYVTDHVPKGSLLSNLLFALDERYEIVTNLDEVDTVNILINHASKNDLSRKDKKFHYSTIITFTEMLKIDGETVRLNKSDSYVSVRDLMNIYNSELFRLASTSSVEDCVEVIISQINEKLTRRYISVIPDQSPKSEQLVVHDERKSDLLKYLDYYDSMSISTTNRPTNHFSKLMAYKNLQYGSNGDVIISYEDNVNGVIRHSAEEDAKISLDIIGHHAIQEALFGITDILVIYNRYYRLRDLYHTIDDASNAAIALPLAVNSLDYYSELKQIASKHFDHKPLSIIVPNRGAFTILPIHLFTNYEITKYVKDIRRSKVSLESITQGR